MKVRRLDKAKETLGYCHDGCHNRAAVEVKFASGLRSNLRLCDRCMGFLIENLSAVKVKKNGKNGKNCKTKTPAGG